MQGGVPSGAKQAVERAVARYGKRPRISTPAGLYGRLLGRARLLTVSLPKSRSGARDADRTLNIYTFNATHPWALYMSLASPPPRFRLSPVPCAGDHARAALRGEFEQAMTRDVFLQSQYEVGWRLAI